MILSMELLELSYTTSFTFPCNNILVITPLTKEIEASVIWLDNVILSSPGSRLWAKSNRVFFFQ